MQDKPSHDIGSLQKELAAVKAELYSLQTARSVRAAKFFRQLINTRRPGDLLDHLRTFPSLLKRSEPPRIAALNARTFPNSVHAPAPLFAYPNVNVAFAGERHRYPFELTMNCVEYDGSEHLILDKFNAVQAVVVDYETYDEKLAQSLRVRAENAATTAKLLLLVDLSIHTKKEVAAKVSDLKYSLVDTSSPDFIYLDIYNLAGHDISAKDLQLVEVGDTLPDLESIHKDQILSVDYDLLSKTHEVNRLLFSLLELAASGVPIIFKGKSPEALKGSPFLNYRKETELKDLLYRPYVADKYRAITKRYTIAAFSPLRVINTLLADHLPHITTKDPLHPTISVLLPTRRPDYVDFALNYLESQTVRPSQVVLMLHGVSDSDYDKVLRRVKTSELTITTSRHDTNQLFGEVLNEGLSMATGEFITKVDDDDHYGENHLYDLCVARLHSQADIVGKWNNWVHITDIDEVISWAPEKENGYYGHLPGGTILARTSLMKELKFGYVRHGIDSELYERGKRRGLILYSTHRYNYVRVRHDDHTYTARNNDFMARAHPVKFKRLNLDNLTC